MDKKTEFNLLKKSYRALENNYVQLGAMLDAIEQILDDIEPSDFMMSFPIVRRVYDRIELIKLEGM